MIHAAVLLLSLAGFACLSLSMARHQQEVFGGRALSPSRSRLLWAMGFLLIASALAVAIIFLGAGFGSVAWFGHISLAAAMVFMALLWQRRRTSG
ncbi:DUF3325 domain-containing protein [Pseudothauera rhizosphaerae]|uniref:DUF3325 domain-containing protein n=1 Tax=Pseudothauera rhizosphaerae TaxID=2565932 RepID=A0A4S4A9B6_9RHOO|nr:DUF3325 domain-containing protein [Pseudothauera rhizosphaerae]THF55400.1 DUF3325 domain-containing protein [Pseudothauera rhizosphaerae]